MNAQRVLLLARPTRRRLQRLARESKDAALVIRVLIVLRYAEGWSTWEIASLVNRVPATVVRVLQRFERLGEVALIDGRRDNGIPKVDADSLQALAEIVERTPVEFGWRRSTWTLELLARALAATVGIDVSITTVHRMLRRLGARWGSPRPVVGCPWPRRRKQARLQEIRRLLARRGPAEPAYYEDEVDIHLNPKIGRDWMMRATQPRILTPGKNQKRYLAGALSLDGRTLVTVRARKKNTSLFLALLRALERRHRTARRIHLVLDNYNVHHAQRAKAFMRACAVPIELHFLPPYSPEANCIERLWLDLHASVTRNHRCSAMDQLMTEVGAWLRREARRRTRLPPAPVSSALRAVAA